MKPIQKIFTFIFISIFSLNVNSQNKLNNYKYVKISKELDIKRKQNQFNINNLLKSYLNKYDFTSFIQGDSTYIDVNPCDILKLKINESGFFTTQISISFYDCQDNNIYTTKESSSRIKEFKPAYYEALGKTLKDPNIVEHQYSGAPVAVKDNSASTTPQQITTFTLEFKGIKYDFKETNIKDEYNIFNNDKNIGTLKKENTKYILNTETLKGSGTFDDFGNFILTRINPVNNVTIKDTMARVN